MTATRNMENCTWPSELRLTYLMPGPTLNTQASIHPYINLKIYIHTNRTIHHCHFNMYIYTSLNTQSIVKTHVRHLGVCLQNTSTLKTYKNTISKTLSPCFSWGDIHIPTFGGTIYLPYQSIPNFISYHPVEIGWCQSG